MAPRLTLISPDFTRLWFGQAVSSIGDMVFSTTLMLWVATVLAKDESWAPAAVSGVLVAGGTAVLVVGPIAGVFVDRWDKIRTMLGTEVLRGGLVALLAAVSFLPADALPAGVWLAPRLRHRAAPARRRPVLRAGPLHDHRGPGDR
ncbi:MFS family permease [Streptomyces sp. HB372]|nr:MFS family permease [Streptomyces sp. HB372]